MCLIFIETAHINKIILRLFNEFEEWNGTLRSKYLRVIDVVYLVYYRNITDNWKWHDSISLVSKLISKFFMKQYKSQEWEVNAFLIQSKNLSVVG